MDTLVEIVLTVMDILSVVPQESLKDRKTAFQGIGSGILIIISSVLCMIGFFNLQGLFTFHEYWYVSAIVCGICFGIAVFILRKIYHLYR